MQHNNEGNRRRRERAVTIFGAIWAAVLAMIIGTQFHPALAGVLELLGP